MAARPLILASASPARLRLLRDAGMHPQVIVSGIDETVDRPTDPWTLVADLATAKARAVAAMPECPADAIVVGCDSMLHIRGEIVGKPGTPEAARHRWSMLRGQTGSLLTGHCVIDVATDTCVSEVTDTVVHFGTPTDAEVDAYIATGEPLQVAGGFTLDGRSASFVDRIEGDPSNVIGLSLPTLRRLLGQLGQTVIDLW